MNNYFFVASIAGIFLLLAGVVLDRYTQRPVSKSLTEEGEIVIVLTSQPTRIVVVNSVVGRKVAEYLTATWAMKVGGTPAKVKRVSEAYRQLVMSGLDLDTIKAILAETGAGLSIGDDNISIPASQPPSGVVIGVAPLRSMSTGSDRIENDETRQGKASDQRSSVKDHTLR